MCTAFGRLLQFCFDGADRDSLRGGRKCTHTMRVKAERKKRGGGGFAGVHGRAAERCTKTEDPSLGLSNNLIAHQREEERKKER